MIRLTLQAMLLYTVMLPICLADTRNSEPTAAPAVYKATAAQQTQKRGTVLVYKTQLPDGSASFSDQKPTTSTFELLRFDCYACQPNSSINWHNTPLFTKQFTELINHTASTLQLDVALLRAVIHAESAFNPSAKSAKGAAGLMQLMPLTQQHFGVTDASDPAQNIAAGGQYLARLLAEFNGDLTFALAAYNAGPAAVRRYQGIPPFNETRSYVERVKILMKRYAAS